MKKIRGNNIIKMKYLHVELPSLHLVWKRAGKEDMVCSGIRTNYPKPSPLLVGAIMRSAGAEVRAVDMKIRNQDTTIPYREFLYEGGKMVAGRMGMRFEDVKEQIEWADVIGLTVNPTSWCNIALDFIVYAKHVNPHVRIWMGGTDAMFRSEFYLRRGVDVVVRGEGESVTAALVAGNFSVPGLSAVRGEEYFDTGIARGCSIDDSPFQALDLFVDDVPLWNRNVEENIPDGVSTPIGFLFASRGCNQACPFCTTPQKYGRLRFRSFNKIQKELEIIKSYGINTINIWDDSLSSLIRLGQRDILIQFVRLLKRMDFAYEFSQGGLVVSDLWDKTTSRPDEELIGELYGNEIKNGRLVGCYGGFFPLEFLQEENPHSAAAKLMSYDKELEVMRSVLSQKIKWLSFSCIIGRQQDGPREIDFAIRRAQEITGIIEGCGVQSLPTPFIYQIYPGTRLWREESHRLVYDIGNYPELYQFFAAPHGTDYFSPGELMEAKMRMEEEVLTPTQVKNWRSTGRFQWK